MARLACTSRAVVLAQRRFPLQPALAVLARPSSPLARPLNRLAARSCARSHSKSLELRRQSLSVKDGLQAIFIEREHVDLIRFIGVSLLAKLEERVNVLEHPRARTTLPVPHSQEHVGVHEREFKFPIKVANKEITAPLFESAVFHPSFLSKVRRKPFAKR
ncbi:MAG TPA: hypothetical protein PLK52_00465 [Usitatibacteraceae bacterium]|nr:hypothetical protein [Usitatibacteraceae bacterium]HRA21993.1 hypothetical protein [Usitatibacteraceae bacterium]